jgi:hypothetical protein
MPPKGTFTDADTSAIVDLLDAKIVVGSLLGKLLGRMNAVTIGPIGEDGSQPHVYIAKPGLSSKTPRLTMVAADVEPRMVQQKIEAADITGAEPRISFGQLHYDFPPGVTGAQVLDFALRSLRTLGVSATTWAYEGQAPDSA